MWAKKAREKMVFAKAFSPPLCTFGRIDVKRSWFNRHFLPKSTAKPDAPGLPR
jgi:hypothetical protein